MLLDEAASVSLYICINSGETSIRFLYEAAQTGRAWPSSTQAAGLTGSGCNIAAGRFNLQMYRWRLLEALEDQGSWVPRLERTSATAGAGIQGELKLNYLHAKISHI